MNKRRYFCVDFFWKMGIPPSILLLSVTPSVVALKSPTSKMKCFYPESLIFQLGTVSQIFLQSNVLLIIGLKCILYRIPRFLLASIFQSSSSPVSCRLCVADSLPDNFIASSAVLNIAINITWDVFKKRLLS